VAVVSDSRSGDNQGAVDTRFRAVGHRKGGKHLLNTTVRLARVWFVGCLQRRDRPRCGADAPPRETERTQGRQAGDLMEAPKCLACGTRHWSRQPCPIAKPKPTARAGAGEVRTGSAVLTLPRAAARERLLDAMAEAIAAKPVTKTPEIPITKPVTKPSITKPISVTKPAVVTKPNKGGRPPIGNKPMTAAERARKYRARKAKAPQSH
jgi:hypothetical protein